jgi:hypothetical protein
MHGTWNEYLVCDIFQKGEIVKAIMNLRVPSNIKQSLYEFNNYEILELCFFLNFIFWRFSR